MKASDLSMLVVRPALMAVLVLVAGSPAFGAVRYVDANAPGGGDGSSWATAFDDLQSALAVAITNDEIWVAGGVYTPTDDPNLWDATFQLVNGVGVYGGFPPGGGDGTFGARDPDPNTNNTILSGDIDQNDPNDNGVSTDIDGSNSLYVVSTGGTIIDPNTTLDGLTITGSEYSGMKNAGDPTVTNCVFAGNDGWWFPDGAGMTNNFGDPTVTNCTFAGNTGIAGAMSNWFGNPIVTDCTFTENSADGGGGGMFNLDSSPTVTNCTFTGNWAGFTGAGMYNGRGSPTVTNCTFTGNWSDMDGGAVYNDNSDANLTNCTFAYNLAGANGAGIYFTDASSAPSVTNCIFWGNSVGGVMNESTQIDGDAASAAIIAYSCIQGCATYCADANDHNIGADPLFVDPNGPDGDPNTWDDNDYHLSSGSPCIDVGDPNRSYTGQTDLDGQARVMGGRVDMGSDEYPGYVLTLTLKGAGPSWVDIDPNDANWLPYVYPPGTDLTLTAVLVGGKSFKKWKIWDANDPNYFAIDTNNPTTILMSADRKVKAIFKCGGGGIEGALPLLAAFGLLGLFALIRRRA